MIVNYNYHMLLAKRNYFIRVADKYCPGASVAGSLAAADGTDNAQLHKCWKVTEPQHKLGVSTNALGKISRLRQRFASMTDQVNVITAHREDTSQLSVVANAKKVVPKKLIDISAARQLQLRPNNRGDEVLRTKNIELVRKHCYTSDEPNKQ